MVDWRSAAKFCMVAAISMALVTIYLRSILITPSGAEWYAINQVLDIKHILEILLVILAAIFFALMDIGDQLRKGGQG